jgi:hypothetical protein
MTGHPWRGSRPGARPALFAKRPVVLAHGDFAPVNVLTDGTSLTGLVDFESVRLAYSLFDVAWWAWAVSFSSPAVLESAWSPFLQGAEIDATEPQLPVRVVRCRCCACSSSSPASRASPLTFSASWPTGCTPCFANTSHNKRTTASASRATVIDSDQLGHDLRLEYLALILFSRCREPLC